MLHLVKCPHDLHSPSQVNALVYDILEALPGLKLRLLQDEGVPDVVGVLHAGQLRDTRPAHDGEEVDDEVSISTQDHEGTRTESAVEFKVLAALKGKTEGGLYSCPILPASYSPLLPWCRQSQESGRRGTTPS